MGLDQSLVPGYQLESYDLGNCSTRSTPRAQLPDIPVVVVRRGAPSMGGDPLPEPQSRRRAAHLKQPSIWQPSVRGGSLDAPEVVEAAGQAQVVGAQ